MPQPQVKVDVVGDNIIIRETNLYTSNTKQINIITLLNKFKELCDQAKLVNNPIISSLITFDQLNKNINRADSIKDGTSSNHDLLPKLFPSANWTLDDLKKVIGGVKTHCINNTRQIERFTFTRTKAIGNDMSRNWGLAPEFRRGYDAGLGLDTLFPGVNYQSILIETFGKYIDPSTGYRNAVNQFPAREKPLILTKPLFAAFGYSGYAACELEATNVGVDRYRYDMTLAGRKIPINNGTNADTNIRKYFGGNVEKSVLLKKSGQEDLKKQVIVGKGLGDKLQVIILWIKSQLQGGNTGIATCDDVVALLCIILELPFFLTSISRDNENVKIDEVLFYNPRGQNPRAALERYRIEYDKVLKSYDDMGVLITLLREKIIPVIASGGGTKELPIDDDFYIMMLADLENIYNWIQATYNSENFRKNASASIIYGEMSELKKLTARQIFKLNKSKTICQFVRTAKTYTCDDRIVYYPFDKPNLKGFLRMGDISKRTFYDLFMKYQRLGGAAKLRGGMPPKAAGGPSVFDPNPEIQINETNIKYKQSNFVYMSKILAYIKPDDPIAFDNNMAMRTMVPTNQTLKNCSTDGQFDANAALRIKLYNLYNRPSWTNTTITFWEVLNECMEVFVYDPRYQTTRLEGLIDTFNIHLYITEEDTLEMSSDTGSSEETTISNETWYLGLGWEPNKVAELELKYESSSNDSNSDVTAEEGLDQESQASSDATSEANRSVPIIGNTPVKEKNPNIPEVTPLKKGGSRRSKNFTQDHKYRNTKRSKKHTTTRKKTAKQSSRTRRSKRRRINKKRRNTTRKN